MEALGKINVLMKLLLSKEGEAGRPHPEVNATC